MRTTTKTIVTIAACAIFGMTSAVAFASENKTTGSEKKTETMIELATLSGENSLNMMETITSESSDAIVSQYADMQISLIQMQEDDFLNTAAEVTAESATMETAKYAELQLSALK